MNYANSLNFILYTYYNLQVVISSSDGRILTKTVQYIFYFTTRFHWFHILKRFLGTQYLWIFANILMTTISTFNYIYSLILQVVYFALKFLKRFSLYNALLPTCFHKQSNVRFKTLITPKKLCFMG